MGKGSERAVRSYVKALDLSAILVVASADGERSQVLATNDPGKTLKAFGRSAVQAALLWCLSHAQAELLAEAVLIGIAAPLDECGWLLLTAAGAVESVCAQAKALGMSIKDDAEVDRAAEQAVARIDEMLKSAQASGGLKEVNRGYKQYRLSCASNGKSAIPYFGWLQNYRVSLIRATANTSRTLARDSFGMMD